MRAFTRWGTVLVAAALAGAGCVKVDTEPATDQKPGVGAHVARGKERQENQNLLRQIALLYQIYHTNLGGARPDLEAFKEGIRKEARKEYEALQEGRFVMRPITNLGSTTVLAYEKDPDLNGNRLVAFADATVKLMSEQEFQAALQNG